MTTYATAGFYNRWSGQQGLPPVVLAKIELTDPSARTLYLSSRDIGPAALNGQTWEPIIETAGPVETRCDVLDEGPNLATCNLTLVNRKFGYQPGGADRVADAFVEYEWQGAAITVWLWVEGMTAWADALQVFSGRITGFRGGVRRAEITAKQDTQWNRRVPDKKITAKTAPGAPEQVFGQYFPVVIGDRRGDPLVEPFTSPYLQKDTHDEAGGGTLVSPGVLVDTGKISGKVKIAFAGHELMSFAGVQGERAFIRGGERPSVLDTGITIINGADGAFVEIPNQQLRAWFGIIPIEVRVTETTADDPLNALDILNVDTYAFLDEVAGKGVLEYALPNLGSLGAFAPYRATVGSDSGAIDIVIAYSSFGDQLAVRFRNAANGALGANYALAKTFLGGVPSLEAVAVYNALAWDGQGIAQGWDFGGNGADLLKGIRIGFTNPGANNQARIYWVGLRLRYTPSRNIIVAGRAGQAAGTQYDLQGRNATGSQPRAGEARFGQLFIPSIRGIDEITADFFANFRGAKDDGSGTHSGVANGLIEHPAAVASWLLATYGAVPLGSIERSASGFGSFVAARSAQRTVDGSPMKVAATLSRKGKILDVLPPLARDVHSFWFVNRFTGKHSWVVWDPLPTSATYDRVLRRQDLVGDDRFAYEKPSDAFIAQTVSVRYGWDAYMGAHIHRAEIIEGDSIGGFAQGNVRDQGLEIVAGVNDKIDWREEHFTLVAFGGTVGTNIIQVANSALYQTGQAVVDPYVYGYGTAASGSAAVIPKGTTITGAPDGTHLSLSNNLLVSATYPNVFCTISRVRSATLTAGTYLPGALALHIAGLMQGQSPSLNIKCDWGGELYSFLGPKNNRIPVFVNGTSFVVILTAGAYQTPAALAAEAQRALREQTNVTTWTVTLGADRKITFASGGPPFSLQWNTGGVADTAAAIFGFSFAANTALLATVTGDVPIRGEGFMFGRASALFSLLWRTGPNRLTNCASTIGYKKIADDFGAASGLYPADFRRAARETISEASVDAHGDKEPIDTNAGWLTTTEMAANLRDVVHEWRAEQRMRIRFSTLRFVDVERGMTFRTDATLDDLFAFPRKGSNGSWANRLWYVTEVRQHLGPDNWHQDVIAVEAGKIGEFLPVAPPATPVAAKIFTAWRDGRAGAQPQAFAGSLDQDGAAAWTANGIQCGAATNLTSPDVDVCADGAGGCYVVWCEGRGSTVLNVFIQRYTAAGAVAGGWPALGVQLRSGVSNNAARPRVTPDGNGGALVAWGDARNGTSQWTVFTQRVNSAGAVQWTANGVISKTGSASVRVDWLEIVGDGTGVAFVAFALGSGTTSTLWVQKHNTGGVVQFGAGAVSFAATPVPTTVANQRAVGIVPDSAGGCFTIGAGASPAVKRLTSSGATAGGWAAGGVVLTTLSDGQGDVALVSDGAGGVIAFFYEVNGTAKRVRAQRVAIDASIMWTAGGVQVGPTITTALTTIQMGHYHAIRDEALTGAVLTWRHGVDGATSANIYVARIDPSGTVLFAVAVVTAADLQEHPTVARDGIGGYYVVWSDRRAGSNADIYAMRVTDLGLTYWPTNGNPLAVASGVQNVPRCASAVST